MSAPVAKPSPHAETPQPRQGWLRNRLASAYDAFPWAAWLASGIVHGGILVGVSLLLVASPSQSLLWLSDDADGPPLEEMSLEQSTFDDIAIPGESGEASLGPITAGDEIDLPGPVSSSVGNLQTGPSNAGSLRDVAGADLGLGMAADWNAPLGGELGALEALSNPLATRGGGLDGRNFENRLEAALAAGGTRESEAAVERGLAWLAEHQYPDGGWQFELEPHPRCNGACRDSGSFASSTAATGLALLSFLGAGYTHERGKYSDVVGRGLYYLRRHMELTTHGGDLRDNGDRPGLDAALGLLGGRNRPRARADTMYSQGIATLAMTEAFAMSHDAELREPAAAAVKFIVNAQYGDGGWRYTPDWEPHSAGDTTVTGWQLVALESAYLADLDVPSETWARAGAFLDGVQQDKGARYAYLQGERGTAATTAVGLLCRMIGGWPRDARPLQKGAALIGDQLPAANNVYFIYYASQVLHHLGGPRWDKWNPRMRDYLIRAQADEGHETGSWYFEEQHSGSGGRLYTTAMAVMTLEVYYRYMPLYGNRFTSKSP